MSAQGGLKKIYIIGASGFAKEVVWLIERINAVSLTWEIMGYIEDNEDLYGKVVCGYPVLGGHDVIEQWPEEIWVIAAIGSPRARKHTISRVSPFSHIRFATLIDPGVVISEAVEIGEGSMICAGSVLTVDVRIGNHVIINLDCTIGHDAVLEDYVTLYPSVNVSGSVTVGTGSELGTSSAIIQSVHIGRNVVIGAGAVVIRDIQNDVTAVGNPAKPLRIRDSSDTRKGTRGVCTELPPN
ncbi:MAG: acetyltransferase [Lachnospiraceae bacterium]|nr:acetyltransferase [Lachnospiraceae bacterium]